ncbi:MAG: DUF5665 domain-containing protein [Halocynthiibacter sp.]
MTNPENNPLIDELKSVRSELRTLNAHRFVNLHNRPAKLLLFQFFRGLAFGLGTVLGASLLASILVYFLSNIDFLPIIGEWAAEIATQIKQREF